MTNYSQKLMSSTKDKIIIVIIIKVILMQLKSNFHYEIFFKLLNIIYEIFIRDCYTMYYSANKF